MVKHSIISSKDPRTTKRLKAALLVLFLIFSHLATLSASVSAQPWRSPNGGRSRAPRPPSGPINPGTGGVGSIPAPGDGGITDQVLRETNQLKALSSLIQQEAEQDRQDLTSINQGLNTPTAVSDLLNADNDHSVAPGSLGEQVFDGLKAVTYYTVGGGWVPKLGWLVAKYMQQAVSEWIGPTIGHFLISRMIAFKDSPDVSYDKNGFSTQMRRLNHLVRNFSYDLLLLFFIMAIWRAWNGAIWGNGRMWGAIGRIIAASACIIAWPEIYHYTIMVANYASNLFLQDMVNRPQEIGDAVVKFFFDAVAFKGINSTNSMIPFDWVFELVVNMAIGLATIVSLGAYFVEKAIQLTIIVMAYVFGPLFLVCLASPDTESYTSSFLRLFVEATMWNFIWGGLTELLVYVVNQGQTTGSPFAQISQAAGSVTGDPQNPWFILLLVLGILQAMLQVPGYLSKGQLRAQGGILEMAFAAAQLQRIIGMFYGTGGLYTALRHGLSNQNLSSYHRPINTSSGAGTTAGQTLNGLSGAGPSPFPLTSGAGTTSGATAAQQLQLQAARRQQMQQGVPLTGQPLQAQGAATVGQRIQQALGAVGAAVSGATVAPAGGSVAYAGVGLGNVASPRGGNIAPMVVTPHDEDADVPRPGPLNVGRLTGVQTLQNQAAIFVQEDVKKRGIATVGENSFDNRNRISLKTAGTIERVRLRAGATPTERAEALTAASLMRWMGDGRGGVEVGAAGNLWWDMVTSAKMGIPNYVPGPLGQALGAAVAAVNPFGRTDAYGHVKQRPLDRFAMWLSRGKMTPGFKSAMELREGVTKSHFMFDGINAYFAGDRNNAIAGYMTDTFGPWNGPAHTPQEGMRPARTNREMAIYRLTNGQALAGGTNNNLIDAMGQLRSCGIDDSLVTNRIVASHPTILRLGKTPKSLAIPAVTNLVREVAANHFGEDATRMTGAELHYFYETSVMPHLQDDHVLAAMAIGKHYGNYFATASNVDSLVQAKRSTYGARKDEKSFENSLSALRLNSDFNSFTGRLPW